MCEGCSGCAPARGCLLGGGCVRGPGVSLSSSCPCLGAWPDGGGPPGHRSWPRRPPRSPLPWSPVPRRRSWAGGAWLTRGQVRRVVCGQPPVQRWQPLPRATLAWALLGPCVGGHTQARSLEGLDLCTQSPAPLAPPPTPRASPSVHLSRASLWRCIGCHPGATRACAKALVMPRVTVMHCLLSCPVVSELAWGHQQAQPHTLPPREPAGLQRPQRPHSPPQCHSPPLPAGSTSPPGCQG